VTNKVVFGRVGEWSYRPRVPKAAVATGSIRGLEWILTYDNQYWP
jgi:hypothetical protein